MKLDASSSPSQNIIAVGVLLILLGVLGSYFYVVPKLRDARTQLATNKADVDGSTRDLAALQSLKTRLNSDIDKMKANKIDTATINEVMPPTEDLPGLYIQMEDVVSRSAAAGVSKPTYSLSSPVEDNGEAKVPISVSGSGTYAQLKSMLSLYQENIRPVTFTSVSFTGDANNPGSIQLTAAGYVRSQGLSAAYASASSN